jgi:iron only hydrogenase large subunit-like protein
MAHFCNAYLLLSRFKEGHAKSWHKPTEFSVAESNTDISVFGDNPIGASLLQQQQQPSSSSRHVGPAALQSNIPVLSSNCPGWVCFAEKTQPQCLPYLSAVKSAQQICGSIIKTLLFPSASMSARDGTEKSIFMVSIQPCFDKKLEMSRKVRILFCG